MQSMWKIDLYEIVNAWKMFPAYFLGFPDGIFAELRSIVRLSLMRVKLSFYWLALKISFMDYSHVRCLGLKTFFTD